jgi:hypothetical protein
MATAADPAERDDALTEGAPDPPGEDADTVEVPTPEAADVGGLFVGREAEIAQAVTTLSAGGSVVVRGKAGIGKRALMREVRRRIAATGSHVCLWPTVATAKQMVADLAEQVHAAIGLEVPERFIPPRFRAASRRSGMIEFRHIKRTLSREPAAEQLNLVLAALAGRDDVILFVESLEIPPTQADMLHQLAEHVQIAATVEDSNQRNRIMRLLWRFQLTLDLKPLTRAEVRAWVTRWLATNPLDFESSWVREAFLTAVAQDSNGIPAAVEGMLTAAAQDRELTRARITGYRHEAAVTYLDMTPMLVIAVAAFMALRYISRGAGLQELMVLAGVGSSLFWMVVFFARRMGGR